MRGGFVTLAVAFLLVAGGSVAAISWRATSTIAVQVVAAPFEIQAGDGAARSRFVEDLVLTANGTGFSVRLQGKAGGDMVVKDVVRVASRSDEAQTLALHGDPVVASGVTAYAWSVRNATGALATLDLTTASPTTTFTLPAGQTYQVDVRLKLAKGAGANNATVSGNIWSVIG